MAWGKLHTKDGKDYKIDDYRGRDGLVEVILAHSHKRVVVPAENVSSIQQGNPNGWEKKFRK